MKLGGAVVFGLMLFFGGCVAAPKDAAVTDEVDAEHDPAEPVNRAIFKANVAADHAVMKPVAQAYTDHVPEGVQKGIHNVVQNLKEPAVAVNDALQGNIKHAWQSVQRLAVNSTAGVAGRASAGPPVLRAGRQATTTAVPASSTSPRLATVAFVPA